MYAVLCCSNPHKFRLIHGSRTFTDSTLRHHRLHRSAVGHWIFHLWSISAGESLHRSIWLDSILRGDQFVQRIVRHIHNARNERKIARGDNATVGLKIKHFFVNDSNWYCFYVIFVTRSRPCRAIYGKCCWTRQNVTPIENRRLLSASFFCVASINASQ